MITIIAAVAKNAVIGKEGGLPWRLPDDLRHFRELTEGKTVLMGRTTFESIVDRLGHPLPNRRNVVLTHDETFSYPGVEVIHDPDEVLRNENGLPVEIYVIGGATLYAAMLPIAGRMYMTEIDADIDGDTYFPNFDKSEWREISRTHHSADELHTYAFDFVEHVRD